MAEKITSADTHSSQEEDTLSERELGLSFQQFFREEFVRFRRGLSRPDWASPSHRLDELRERHEKREKPYRKRRSGSQRRIHRKYSSSLHKA